MKPRIAVILATALFLLMNLAIEAAEHLELHENEALFMPLLNQHTITYGLDSPFE